MATKNVLQDIEREIKRYVSTNLPRTAGKMAVDEFRENFHRQGFRNNGLHRWPDVKRRDPSSPWYGFQYKGEHRTSVRIVRDRKTGKTRRSQSQSKLNFSNSATKRGILIGPGSNLMRSVTVRQATAQRVAIGTDLPYAEVHNEGGYIRVFGKAKVKVPKRQFIGESRELMQAIEKKFLREVDRITDEVAARF
ncbi:phage virion morphogenesis protein [Bacteroides sp.]|uniref:phage virion morphogenesis protein n=1 Tax=Bacteroides sp. TaxID=29523 RepID=UPI0025BE28EC|nr:phage virion morphogenesis protein [Bacteroides sp.]